ncbi:uncharacterized protein Tco025E_04472 [Trypanosoma conorhini]|uniref:Uncharacterized protein n=1 Tax=Trypanosoma conorhini TaxID=83891 RepID=A0A3R7L2N1_9TRYP|nr:uncharacterized protein Tco025E_04472 [Trypanosoma conorhini]RNF18452.1 hypothetical protein Tco025E_04472 [Trypanosoma conorhini]
MDSRDGRAIQVSPPQGFYVNFDIDTTYVIPFTVRNDTRSMCTVRFTPPSNQRVFRINTTSVRLAPGLSHVIEAEFITHVSQDYQDSFVVFTNDESVTVPLVAKCSPDLEFPATVNFGRVERNRHGLSKALRLTNKGRREKHVQILAPAQVTGVKVNPLQCVAPPMGCVDVYLELLKLDVGFHRLPLQLDVADEAERRTVMLVVEVMDSKGVLLDPRSGEEVHALGFAKTYAGTRRVVEVDVRNDSEQPVSFAFQVAGDASAEQQQQSPFDFIPRQGRLGPHEKTRVSAVFSPPISYSPRGWSCRRENRHTSSATYETLYSLLFLEVEHTHTLRVTGSSTATVAWLSQAVVDFGQCAMNDYRDVTVTVHNGHKDMPLQFLFPRVAHFLIDPAEGKVKPGASCDVRLTFRPRRLGAFEEHLRVVFNETEKESLTLSGVAKSLSATQKIVGGVDKLPEDFVSMRKGVSLVQEPPCASTGRAAAATATSVDAVDLGMIPAEGLVPPEPEPPTAIYKRKSAGEFSILRGGDHFSPVALDAKTLIRKVFKETPSNATERRDCRRELQPMELLRIAAPIKVMDYQRVTVGSTSTKMFFLYNGTAAAVLAEMPTEETHLSFSPHSQVIPAGRAAAYDVSFCSSVVQTYQQIVQIKINGRYMLRFTLQADVVPVEVTLSRDDVVLNFTEFADDPMAHATVTLFNHGNSEAAYAWALNPGPFMIEPTSGSIAPMSKVTAQLTFIPPQGVLNAETKAELHVKGALTTRVLNLKGIIAPTSCGWSTAVGERAGSGLSMTSGGEYVLKLQQVPAGVTTKAKVMLHNRGRNSAFFSFESIPEWLMVTPMCRRVGVGETEEITLAVHHEMPGLVQASLLCCVRGMKRPLRLGLTAEVCVAPLSIVAPPRGDGEILLEFDSVYIGTEKALPVRFCNSGDVAAVIFVDLRSLPEYSLRCPDGSVASLEWRGRGEPVPGEVYVTIPPRSEAGVLVVYRPTSVGKDERFLVVWRHIGTDEMNPLMPLAVSARALVSKVVVRRQNFEFPRTVVGTTAVPLTLTIENVSGDSVRWELLLTRDENSKGSDDKGSAGEACPFQMNPESGTLAPHKSQLVHVTFVPNLEGNRHERYCVYLDGNQLRPCAEVRVSGLAALPRIVCDRDELIFPAVPLNVVVRETMYIANDGFDSIEVRYSSKEAGPLHVTFPHGAIFKSSSRIPVRVEFCSSKPVSLSTSITFTSDVGETLTIPVTATSVNSFLTTAPYVMFQRGRSHIGLAEDAATGGERNEEEEEVEGREEAMVPFIYWDDVPAFPTGTAVAAAAAATKNALASATPVASTTTTPISHPLAGSPEPRLTPTPGPFVFVDAVGRSMYSRHAIENLQLWLNHCIFQKPVSELVPALQSTEGRSLLEAAYRLSGKRPSRLAQPSGGERSLAFLQSLTSVIKSRGGCLSEVRLPYLMKYSAYCALQESSGGEVLPPAAFAVRADHAWVTVILQFIRVLYLPKVDLAAMLRLYPATKTYFPRSTWESAPFQAALRDSNVFSPEEGLLLRWVTYNVRKCVRSGVLKGGTRVILGFDDLRDCVGVLACILAYVPSAAARLSSMERLVAEPTTQTEMENNAAVLLGALMYIGFPVRATPRELLEYNTVDWLLLVVTLFILLPRFIPTAVLSLEGKLLVPMSRSLEVANTSNTERTYTVEMGNSVFRALPRDFSVDAGGVAQLNVEVTLRFNRRVEGECVVVDTSACLMEERAPIAFRLVAVPNQEPLRVVNIQTPLYTALQHEMLVESPFQENCVATLRFAQEYKSDAAYPEGDFGKTLHNAFNISAGVIPFRSGEATKVMIQFVPCARGKYEARITFHDEQQGEFSYLVIGTCTPPKVTDKVSIRAESGEECTHTLLVKFQNVPFERMLRTLEEHRRPPASRAAKNSLMPDLVGVPYTVTFVNEANVGPNPFYRGPDSIAFVSGESMVPLSFSFLPKQLGEYNGYILLASKYDVRSIQVTGKCVPTGEKGVLRFACPARQFITQGLPVTNNSNENWLIKATVEGPGFSGPKELRVPRGKQREYPLRYSPAWTSSAKGNLTLFNNETGERCTYVLIGEAEEPLSEDALVIECRARERCTVPLTVPDVSGVDATYHVETDLPFARGGSSVLVHRGSTARYLLVLHPMMGGTYSGTVVCRAPNGRYAWYAITVNVSPPEKEGTVEIKTDTRTPVTADVSINNPTNKSIVFNVRRFGPGLFGENSLLLEAGAPAVYSLLFVPSQLGSFDGRLAFCSDEAGEFWYELRIIVEESVPEEITFESEIGVPDIRQVRIPNDTSVERNLYVSNSNPRNFSTAPALLTIPAYSELTLDVVYTPTAVDRPQEAMLKLYNPDLGEWRYHCRGVGMQPAESPPVQCVCEVGGKVSVALKIKNPFDVPMTPNVRLTSDKDGYYSLTTMPQLPFMAPGAETAISLTYTPKSVGRHAATVLVRPDSLTQEVQDVTWRFPLRGVAEWRCRDAPLRFRCVARRQVEETVTLNPPGLTEEEKEVSVVLELEHQQQYANAVESSFQSTLEASDTAKGSLTVKMRFAPLRPFLATADLVVRSEKGAVWRYSIVLDAVRAEVDDVVTIKAAFRTVSAVTFSMYNVFPHSSPFSAYFTPESSRDLSVINTRGVLHPFLVGQRSPGSATPLQVRFAPSARLPQVEGTLIVDTEDMQWSFKVIGKLEDAHTR